MERVMWSDPARELIGQAPPTLDGLWTAVFAAQSAALWLALSASIMPVGDFTEVAMDLGEAVTELELARPDLAVGPSVEVGMVSPIVDYAGPSAELADLIRAGVELAVATLANTGEALTAQEILATSRAVQLLHDAHVRLTGRLP